MPNLLEYRLADSDARAWISLWGSTTSLEAAQGPSNRPIDVIGEDL